MIFSRNCQLTAFLIALFLIPAAYAEAISTSPSRRVTSAPVKADPYIQTLNFNTQRQPSETLTIPIPTDKVNKLKSESSTETKQYQVSTHIDIPEAGKSMFTPYMRQLQTKGGLSSKRVAIYAKDAVFIRPHFLTIPSNVSVFIYGVDGQSSARGPVTDNSTKHKGDGFWGPPVAGDFLFVEVVGDNFADVSDLVIDKISYGFINPLSTGTNSSELSCNVDVNCSSSTAASYKNAVALIYFEKSDGGYLCSGSMIADTAASNTNWFLTANHCISSGTEASTLVAYFGYRTSLCNGTVPSISNTSWVDGSDYIAGTSASDGTDFTLLKLHSNPPAGTYYLGWTTNDISETVDGIHYPKGSYERIAEGSVYSTSILWSGINNEGFATINFTSGIIENGSSGSPLMLKSSGKIVGQLYGSDTSNSCNSSTRIAIYGKFAKSYYNYGLSAYLNSSSANNAGSSVTYNIPFLNTNSNVATYCWLSNTLTETATATFTVMSNNSSALPSQTASSTNIFIAGKKTTMLTFNGLSITSGATSVDLSNDISGNSISYALKMLLTTIGTDATCESIGMSCFQGTTSPRRNLKGYTCNDNKNHYDF
ncbi:MAG: trypsin-like peptidase domain-containing protein [Nitrospirae bacterium]|nr:trypsin-like peptidase domain-containing protein [Nitrospirota bacterium]MBF0535501.1 trypsin-like peptidase domain-containing protein [Nitrospirota bacterium]MBF0617367.1 trypsin-like peptidase domain-containing protein [Nitrospirota bacterium]